MNKENIEFRGIVLYDIERNGCLNGVYTNNLIPNTEIFTETARLRREPLTEGETEIQVYDSFYFDINNVRVNCTLEFRITNGVYRVQWTRLGENTPLFVGEGFQMNDRQIAISYWLPAS